VLHAVHVLQLAELLARESIGLSGRGIDRVDLLTLFAPRIHHGRGVLIICHVDDHAKVILLLRSLQLIVKATITMLLARVEARLLVHAAAHPGGALLLRLLLVLHLISIISWLIGLLIRLALNILPALGNMLQPLLLLSLPVHQLHQLIQPRASAHQLHVGEVLHVAFYPSESANAMLARFTQSIWLQTAMPSLEVACLR